MSLATEGSNLDLAILLPVGIEPSTILDAHRSRSQVASRDSHPHSHLNFSQLILS